MENHRTLSNLPQNPPLQSAAQARMIVSWWDREIHIWRLQKPLKEIVDLAGADSDATKNRKLLARILIKGEANITSASISSDGSLLLVSTTSEIKAFHLASKSETRRDELKISKVDVPVTLSARGATDLKISPDGNWVCVSQEGTRISILQISRDSNDADRPVIHSKATRLNRIRRNILKHTSLGGLGQYDRSITQIAFSADTRMLAVADVAGYIDTWILRDSMVDENATNSDAEDEDVSSDDESDNEEEGDAIATGPFWVRNPNGALMPKLYSAPTVLSFSEHVPGENQSSAANGNTDVVDDYVLLAITAKLQILTLHPTAGSITPWSRRNPVQRFPVEFRNIRDLVKGVLWAGERVWLYGNTFVVMIDMSKDIAEDVTNPSSALVPLDDQQQRPKKRKRGGDTGAGNKMQVGAAGPTKVEHYVDGEGAEVLDLDAMDTDVTSVPDDDSDSDDSEEELQGELASRRRAEGKKGAEGTESQGVGFWHTLKYRPILGIVPLQESIQEQEGDDDVVAPYMNGQVRKTLEVALVERPLWDTDMSDRYFADGEFER